MKRLAIIGSSRLAQQIAHHAHDCSYTVAGFFDDFKEPGQNGDQDILGKIADVKKIFDKKKFDEVMVGIGYNFLAFRAEVFDNLTRQNIPFATMIHPTCIVDRTAVIGKGSILYPGSIIDQRVVIKDNVLINPGCMIGHDSVVGSNSFLAGSVTLGGLCTIGEQCYLGLSTTVIDNITICDKVQTGASALVIRPIDKPGVYIGVPAVFLRN